ncbi:MAG: DUF1223 domain-containing protein [Candidatus Acidiferrales bacterium]
MSVTLNTSLSLLAMSFLLAAPLGARTSTARSSRIPVVVELFTSEGCSDCPPADALLKNLEMQQPIAGVEVIPVEEHVDYWNHDGWIDPFSSADWTIRQQEYETKLKGGTEYTPQMIVDGETQFVGSYPAAAVAAITTAAREPQTEVTVTAGQADGKDAQRFAVSVGKLEGSAPGNTAEVWLAVTEDGLHSDVKAGENAGHALYHAAVLRSLNKIGSVNVDAAPVAFTADPRVKFNSHWNRANLRVVVFVQDKHSKKILGAAETRVLPAS